MSSAKLNPEFTDLKDPKTLIRHINDLQDQHDLGKQRKGLLKVKTANQWLEEAKLSPVPQMLFAELWHENELCVLFADTNLGKSILAVQIGNSLSKGKPIPGFKLETTKQNVVYLDFELSAKQFEVRYSVRREGKKVFENHYRFDENFKRVEIDPDAEIPEGHSFESHLNHAIEEIIIQTGAKVLIIDNITYLKNETEKAKNALPLMQHLKALKSKHGLSILVLAHTPKRDLSKPITRNDLQGSKMLINFVDSAFAIGESYRDKSLRYIKQIKARNTEMMYDTDNVIVCQIQKPFNILEFEFVGFGTEREHLRQLSDTDRDNRITESLELKRQGNTNVQIAKHFGVSEGAVRKWFKKNGDVV